MAFFVTATSGARGSEPGLKDLFFIFVCCLGVAYAYTQQTCLLGSCLLLLETCKSNISVIIGP